MTTPAQLRFIDFDDTHPTNAAERVGELLRAARAATVPRHSAEPLAETRPTWCDRIERIGEDLARVADTLRRGVDDFDRLALAAVLDGLRERLIEIREARD